MSGAEHSKRLSRRLSRHDAVSRAAAEVAVRRGDARGAAALPGVRVSSDDGWIHLLDRQLDPDHRHGEVPIAGALQVGPSEVAELGLDPALAGVDLQQALFFDTETTGLGTGAGTIPFLIGLAWFEGRSLRLQQALLPAPGQETPMLRWFARRVEAASCLVTYNGKSFDWPLVRTRCVLNRVALPAAPPHVDLLAWARRVYRLRLERVPLVRLEEQLLGLRREGDIGGAQIPAAYLRYLRFGETHALAGVMEHNAHDLTALAAVLVEIARGYASVRPDDDPRDHYSYARVAERARADRRAAAFARAAAEGRSSAELAADAWGLSARVARRRRKVREEEATLLAALRAADSISCPIASAQRRAALHLALAKLYEHRRKDMRQALVHAGPARDAESPEANSRRTARLRRRLGDS